MTEVSESLETKIEPVFLVESDLCWERPLQPGYWRAFSLNGKTELIENKGTEIIHHDVGRYFIVANAAIYLANVIRILDRDQPFLYDKSMVTMGPPKREIILNGDITIYRTGPIEGEKISGADRIDSGRIWVGRNEGDSSLYKVIFGEETTEEKKIARIESILAGYEQAESERQSDRLKRDHSNFNSGRISGRDGY